MLSWRQLDREQFVCREKQDSVARARTIEDERNDGTPTREHINYQATRRRGETVSYLRVTDGTRQLRKGIEVNSPHTFHDGVVVSSFRIPARGVMERPTGVPLIPGTYLRDDIRVEENAEALSLHATYGLTAVRERSVERQIPHLIYNFRSVPVEYRSVPMDGIMNGSTRCLFIGLSVFGRSEVYLLKKLRCHYAIFARGQKFRRNERSRNDIAHFTRGKKIYVARGRRVIMTTDFKFVSAV